MWGRNAEALDNKLSASASSLDTHMTGGGGYAFSEHMVAPCPEDTLARRVAEKRLPVRWPDTEERTRGRTRGTSLHCLGPLSVFGDSLSSFFFCPVSSTYPFHNDNAQSGETNMRKF